MSYPSYFLQSPEWAEFWLEANPINHAMHTFEHSQDGLDLTLQVFEYPWVLGQKFWYIPRMPASPQDLLETDKINLESAIRNLTDRVFFAAKESNIAFIKFDYDSVIATKYGLENIDDALQFSYTAICEDTLKSAKHIQFLETMTLDLRGIPALDSLAQLINLPVDVSTLQDFYDANKDFWSPMSERVKRYTKKTIKGNWSIDFQKTQANFEAYYKVYTQTADRQNFAIHSKEYLQKMFENKHSRIIVLRSSEDEPECVWLGWSSKQTLTYISGGNTPESLKNHTQYLIFLASIMLAKSENKDFLDLGGYDSSKGFGKFKEGYKGDIRKFLGPIDIPVKKWHYKLINSLIFISKKLKFK